MGRSIFTKHQKKILEEYYLNKNTSSNYAKELAEEFNMDKSKIANWFRNRKHIVTVYNKKYIKPRRNLDENQNHETNNDTVNKVLSELNLQENIAILEQKKSLFEINMMYENINPDWFCQKETEQTPELVSKYELIFDWQNE